MPFEITGMRTISGQKGHELPVYCKAQAPEHMGTVLSHQSHGLWEYVLIKILCTGPIMTLSLTVIPDQNKSSS